MTTINSNVISILSDPKVSERAAKAPEAAPRKAPESDNSDAVVSEIRARDRVQTEDEAFALVGSLKQNILGNRDQAFQAQANQQPDDTQILLS